MNTKKFILTEKEIPTAWYNILAEMKNKPRPMENPQTKQPLKEEDLYPLFSRAASHQEMNTTDVWIEIPEEVREMYKIWRPTPLVRATGLERALDTPAHIYFKNESVSPVGSHKLNSAIAQAYFCKQEGVTNITTETGAGQWGAALSLAAKHFGLELRRGGMLSLRPRPFVYHVHADAFGRARNRRYFRSIRRSHQHGRRCRPFGCADLCADALYRVR